MSNTWERAYPEEGIAWSNDNAPYLNEANLGIMNEALKTHDKRLLDLYGYRTTMVDLVNKAEAYGDEAKEYVDAQTKENEEYVNEKVAGAEATIANAQKAIDKANTTADNAKKSVDSWIASANIEMDKMQEQTDTATNNANAAANNANEAAQAIFDEKYILTARTEFNRSASVSPTAKGNAILEKMRGDSWQRTLSGKNLVDFADKTETRTSVYYVDHALNIEPTVGQKYILSFDYTCNIGPTPEISIGCGDTMYLQDLYRNRNIQNGRFVIAFTWEIKGSPNYTKLFLRAPRFNTPTDFTYSISNLQLEVDDGNGVATDHELYCGGTASPNPSFKQDILSVGDSGWFDGVFVKAYLNTANGSSIVTSDAVASKNTIPCNSGDSIKIKYGGGLETTTGKPPRVCFYDVNGNFISGHNYNSANGIKVPNGAASFKFDMTFNSTTFKLSDVGHVCVTINDKYALIMDEVGKNLWPCGDLSGNGSLIPSQSVRMPKGTYTISLVSSATSGGCDIYFSNDKGSVKTVYFNNKDCNTRKSYTFTLVDDVNKIGLYANTNTNITGVQLEEGSVETNFVAHRSKRHYIPLDEPLRGIGDVGNEIKCVDGLYGAFRNYEEKIYDSANLSAVSQTYGNVVYYALNKPTSMDGYGQFKSVVVTSNRFVSGHGVPTFNTEQAVNKIFTNATKDTIWLGFPIGTTLEGARAIGDIVLVYPLATPTFTPFEDQTPFYNLEAYDEVTHVSIVGCHEELNPIATMRFPRNEDGAMVTTNWCDNKKNEIRMNELTAALLALGRE